MVDQYPRGATRFSGRFSFYVDRNDKVKYATSMKVDHILYESNITGIRTWVCHISECDGLKRMWRAEKQVGESKLNDEEAKSQVIDEAYARFREDTEAEMANP